MDMLEWNSEGKDYRSPIQALMVSCIFRFNTNNKLKKKVVYILLKLKIQQSKSIECIYLSTAYTVLCIYPPGITCFKVLCM